jgi:hypothetical protein
MSVERNGSPSQPPDPKPSNGPEGLHRPVAVGGLVHSREFLELLAGLRPLMGQASAPVTKRRGKHRSSRLLIAALLVLLSALTWRPVWSWWSAQGSTPGELLGTWTTSSARFADRGFVITTDSLRLFRGPGRSSTYRIAGVGEKSRPGWTLYTFHYREGGSPLELKLWMGTDSTVQIANLPGVVWKKVSP